MKKILLLLISCYSLLANGQNLVSPISITLPSNPPANTADWATAIPSLRIIAQAKTTPNGQVSPLVVESRILVTIKASGGNKVCGIYNQQNAPGSGFNSASKTWAGAAALGLLGQDCVLPPGTYQLCVQFYGLNAAQAGLLGEGCSKPFTIVDTKQQTYSPPQNVLPADGKEFTNEESKQPINFRWTPVLPKPKAKVKYTVRVWDIPIRANKNQVIKTQPPAIIKETEELTQLSIPASEFKLGRRENGSYAWNVQASKQTQMGDIEMLGTSEATSFSASPQYIIQLDSIKVTCSPIAGTYGFSYTITNPNAGPATLNSFALTSSVPTGAVISSFSPAIGTVINSGTQLTVSGIILGSPGLTNVCLGAEIKAVSNSFWKASRDTCANVPACKCDLCDEKNIGWEIQSRMYYDSARTNNILTVYNDIVVNPSLKVVKLSAEVVDFYWYTEGDCKKCSNNDFYWGNIISGSINSRGFVSQGTSVADDNGVPLTSSHQLDFISSNPSGSSLNGGTYLNISLPPQTTLSCCTDCFRFCVRYTITFMENGICKTCSIVKCYETKRKHRKAGLQQWPPLNECGERVIINHGGGAIEVANPVKKD